MRLSYGHTSGNSPSFELLSLPATMLAYRAPTPSIAAAYAAS